MLGTFMRFVFSALALLMVCLLIPGFRPGGLAGALAIALAVAALGRAVFAVPSWKSSPASRGLAGFAASGAVIYAAQFLAAGLSLSFPGIMLAAIVIGLVDGFMPVEFY